MSTTDGLYTCFREAEVPHLALLDKIFHSAGGFFDGHVGIDAVLIEQVDHIGPETLERGLGDLLDMFGTAVQPGLFAGARIKLEPKLGGDHHLPTERSESFAHEFFVCERPINLGGVEECDTAFSGRPNYRNHFLFVPRRTVAKTHSHAAEPKGRNFQVAFSKFALLHYFSFEYPQSRPLICFVHFPASIRLDCRPIRPLPLSTNFLPDSTS